jgi:CO/xanthine dehydrogenase Mo-binding subunit
MFASEAQMDLIARELGMDPVEFLKNLVEDGDETPLGHHLINVMGKRTLNAAVEAAEYHQPKPQIPVRRWGEVPPSMNGTWARRLHFQGGGGSDGT